MVIGSSISYKLILENKTTGLPADSSVAADVDLVLLSNNQVVAKYGTGTGLTPVGKPSAGVFVIPFPTEVTSQLQEGMPPVLEGFILPSMRPIRIVFSKAVKLRHNG